MTSHQPIEVGQLWADKDPREAGRVVRVVGKTLGLARVNDVVVEVVRGADDSRTRGVGRRNRLREATLRKRYRLIEGEAA